MTIKQKKEIISKAKVWMRNNLIQHHKANTLKLKDIDELDINPFLWPYLSYYFKGNADFVNLAKVLLYPRILGTSITTSFGSLMQRFMTIVLSGYGSTTPGIDIEFVDQIDGRKKYCQIKSGPNALNRDDVTTVDNHFRALKNLSRTNNLNIPLTDMIFCLIYGEPKRKNSFIRELEKMYPVYMGKEFWHRFTGDEDFYKDMIMAMAEVANEVNMKKIVNDVISEVAIKLKAKYKQIYG